MNRKATAVWRGAGKDGLGHLTTPSDVLSDTQYSYKSRFESGTGTNPEELIAAAHAGCFAMQLAFNLQGKGYTAEVLEAVATVSLEDGSITKSHIQLTAKVPTIDESEFEELVRDAEKNCPVSKVLNADVQVDYTLDKVRTPA